MIRRVRRGDDDDDRGSATVEVTLAMPLLGLLLLLIVQFAFWAHATHVAQAAANQGVQSARAYGSTASAGADDTTAILDQTAGSILVNRSVTANNTATTSTVTVTGKAAAVVPGLSLPITVSVTAPREKVPGMP
jgi:Flp pilus assembly protein TadG